MEAETLLREALARRAEFPEALQTLAVIAVEQSRFAAAAALQKRAVLQRPNDANARRAFGVYLFRSGDTAAAIAELQSATALDSKFAAAWTSLGWAYRALGRFEDAVACYNRALEIDPQSAEVRRSLVVTGRTDANATDLERLSLTLADPGRSLNERVSAGFARAELLDKQDRFDEAFACFVEANTLAHQGLVDAGRAYSADRMQQRVDRLIAEWTQDRLAAAAEAGNKSERPVFIVGMPRSGSSLVEQILSSHSSVFGAGELNEIGKIADELPPLTNDPGQIAAWTVAARHAASAHVAHLEALGGGAPRIIDKLPDNLLHLGLIAALFPLSRIIFCERDPRDICLSNYFQLFAGGNPWSYDLADCGHRFRQVDRLADHWRKVLPVPWLRVSYEALVGDLEGESRRLVAFLGLNWEAACLDFHRTERVVVTQSTWQVRQELFTRSVGRWRSYERHLAPLLAALV
jgi:tetratricopeptide (TPR) repeat protein